jgi:hypothetical protein
MSLLSLVQDACALVGLDVPMAVASSTDPTYTQFMYLAQFEGDELSRRYKWREQKVAADFTGDGITTTWALPEDFDRFTTEQRRESSILLGLDGPVSDDEFLDAQVRGFNPTIPYYRLFNGNIETTPAVADGQQVRFEYISSYWITDNMGVAKARFTADSDLSLLPDRLVTLGLVWRWKRAKGLDYAEEFRTYQMEKLQQARVDGGSPRLRLAEGSDYFHPYTKNAYSVTP